MTLRICDETIKKVSYSSQEIKIASDVDFLNLNLLEPTLFMSYEMYMLKCPITFKFHRPAFVRRSQYGVHVRDISTFDRDILSKVLYKLTTTCWNFTSIYMKLDGKVVYEEKEEKSVRLKIAIKGYKIKPTTMPSLVLSVVEIC